MLLFSVLNGFCAVGIAAEIKLLC